MSPEQGKTQAYDDFEMETYKLTDKALGIARWHMDVVDGDTANPANVYRWSPEFRNMLGFAHERDFPDMLDSWSGRLHPQDSERVLSAFRAHVGDRTGKTPYNLEYRLMTKSGAYRHFRAVGLAMRDAAGVALRVAGAMEDITDRVMQQESLERILDAMDSYVYITEIETDELLFANRKMAADFGLDVSAKGD